MKRTMKSGNDTNSSRREAAPAPPAMWPKVVPAPAVWEAGAMANRRGQDRGSLYRPRKMGLLNQPEPLW